MAKHPKGHADNSAYLPSTSSRYGKAALVAMAYPRRFAPAFVAAGPNWPTSSSLRVATCTWTRLIGESRVRNPATRLRAASTHLSVT